MTITTKGVLPRSDLAVRLPPDAPAPRPDTDAFQAKRAGTDAPTAPGKQSQYRQGWILVRSAHGT